jgi:endonuclease/exonuclease/phosphatase family metal-dependent hydrolase
VLQFRVATFNTRGARPLNAPASVTNICRFLDTLEADLIGLQEVHRFLPPPGVTQDQPARYRRHLRRPVTFRRSLGIGKIGYGNALISKVEPISVRRHLLPSAREQRSVLECDYVIEGHRARVLNTHFGLDPQERLKQAAEVAILLPSELPALLIGDLNATPDSPEIQLLIDAGWRFCGDLSMPTFQVPSPTVRIDYIAGNALWTCEHVRVAATEVSDHYAVVADLSLGG